MKNETTELMILEIQKNTARITKLFEDDAAAYSIPPHQRQNFFNHFVIEQLALLFVGLEVASGEYDKRVAKKIKKAKKK